jgi:hypothetical protein
MEFRTERPLTATRREPAITAARRERSLRHTLHGLELEGEGNQRNPIGIGKAAAVMMVTLAFRLAPPMSGRNAMPQPDILRSAF